MRAKLTVCLALLCLLALGGQAIAEICTIDDVPAATLLLPYFEVDLGNLTGVNTLFSINNASNTAAVAHVTMWTDESIPTLDFDVYLTGYDVQTISMRDIFNGILPRTADVGIDPDAAGPTASAISNLGNSPATTPATLDQNFAGSTGPCGTSATIYNAGPTPTLSATLIAHIRASHTGFSSTVYGGCVGLRYGDNIARGYITVDNVNQCNLQFPGSTGYFVAGGTGLANNNNTLWGDYFYVNDGQNYAQGETLAHIEACSTVAPPSTCAANPTGICQTGPSVGQNADDCPFLAGEYTFYGRYLGVPNSAADQREPLATNFATRYINGGAFTGGTDLIVWRDAKTPLGASIPVHSCPGNFTQFPLNQADVVAFDEMENPTNLCFQGSNVSPPTGGVETCFPVEAQRVSLSNSIVPLGATPSPPSPFGWMFLNLNTTVTGESAGLPPGIAQAWVTTVMNASGRFSVGFDAIKLDTACDNLTGGIILIP
jgi:hypothetical protein